MRKRKAIWVCAIIAAFGASSSFADAPTRALNAPVIAVTDGYLSAGGTFRYPENIGTADPYNTHEIKCYRELGKCFDSWAIVYESGSFKAGSFLYDVKRWDEEAVIAGSGEGSLFEGWFFYPKTNTATFRRTLG
jgi:hypothetical protein